MVKCEYWPDEQERLLRAEVGNEIERTGSEYDSAANSEKKTVIYSNLDSLRALAPRFSRLAARLKHETFHEEREWRLRIRVSNDKVLYRESRGNIVPYVIFRPVTGLPLVELVVGPSPHQERSERTAKGLLAYHGFDPTIVRKSKTPFRSW